MRAGTIGVGRWLLVLATSLRMICSSHSHHSARFPSTSSVRQVGRRCGALEVHLPQDSSCSSRLATELPAGAPEFEHVFSRQVGRRCGALEVHLPQDSSCSSRLATESAGAGKWRSATICSASNGTLQHSPAPPASALFRRQKLRLLRWTLLTLTRCRCSQLPSLDSVDPDALQFVREWRETFSASTRRLLASFPLSLNGTVGNAGARRSRDPTRIV